MISLMSPKWRSFKISQRYAKDMSFEMDNLDSIEGLEAKQE